MTDDDIPGYLLDAIRKAEKSGLRKLNITFTGSSAGRWQASSMHESSVSFYVVRDNDLAVAVIGALNRVGTVKAETPAAIGLFD